MKLPFRKTNGKQRAAMLPEKMLPDIYQSEQSVIIAPAPTAHEMSLTSAWLGANTTQLYGLLVDSNSQVMSDLFPVNMKLAGGGAQNVNELSIRVYRTGSLSHMMLARDNTPLWNVSLNNMHMVYGDTISFAPGAVSLHTDGSLYSDSLVDKLMGKPVIYVIEEELSADDIAV